MQMRGLVTIVSGGSRGLGRAIAKEYAREGAKVVVTARPSSPTGLAGSTGETAQDIRTTGGEALAIPCDVADEEPVIAMVQQAMDTYGRIDVLVNNAGIVGGRRGLEETTVELWQAQMDVHVKGMFLGIKHAVPEMRKVGGGSIINLSSVAGMIGMPRATAYSAAKATNRLLTKSAAIQYAKDNIRVNSVHPGYCVTPLTDANFSDPEFRALLLSTVPTGEFGSADDIAFGILYLASDESSYVTGAELVIDDGVTAQ